MTKRFLIQTAALIFRPFGPNEGGEGDGAQGDGQGGAGQGESGNAGGNRATSPTMEDFQALTNTIGELRDQIKSFGNFRNQVSRHLNIGRNRRDEGGNDEGARNQGGQNNRGDEGLTDAEKRANAAEKRLADIEKRADQAQISRDLREQTNALEGLVAGAAKQIERVLKHNLRVVDGETMYDDGESLIPLSEALENEAKNSLYRKAAGHQADDSNNGESGAGDGGNKGFDDLDLDSMSDDEIEKLEGQYAADWRRPQA